MGASYDILKTYGSYTAWWEISMQTSFSRGVDVHSLTYMQINNPKIC